MTKICLFAPQTKVFKDNEEVPFPGSKCRNLFTYLLINRDNYCSRNRLADIFWSNYPPDRARKNLNNSLWLLKKMIKDAGININIKADSTYLSLEIDKNTSIDIDLFFQLLEQAKTEDILERKERILKEAITLAQYHFLSEEEEIWLETIRIKINNYYKRAIFELLNTYFSNSLFDKAINLCYDFLEKDPLEEKFIYQLIKLLHLTGEKRKALQEYQRYCCLLSEELSLEPAKELQEISQLIKQEISVDKNMNKKKQDKSISGIFLGDLPLIGRKQGIRRCQEILKNSIKNNQLSLLVIKGIAGIGKTRFIQELIIISRLYNLEIIKINCFKTIKAPAYSLITSIIDALLHKFSEKLMRQIPAPYLNILSYFVPEIGQNKGSGQSIINDPGEQFTFELTVFYKAVNYLLEQVIKKNPLLIILDDLHHADQESLNLLIYLINTLKHQKLILIQSVRSEELSGEINQYFSAMNKLDNEIKIEEIRLNPLTNQQISRFIELGLKPKKKYTLVLKKEIMDMIMEETAGIPLFIIEILRFWKEKGTIFFNKKKQTWDISYSKLARYQRINEITESIEIPEKFNTIFQARLNQLDIDLINILQLAAIVGFDFSTDIIFHILDKPEQEVIFALDQLICCGLFHRSAEDNHLRFSHLKLREYIYGSINELKQRYFHKEVYYYFQSINTEATENTELISRLAWHAYGAGMWREAVKYNLLSANLFKNKGIIFQAVHYLKRALMIYNKSGMTDTEILFTLYKSQGEVHFYLGEGKKAKDELQLALKLTNNSLSPEQGEIYSFLAQACTRRGEFSEALTYIENVLELEYQLSKPDILTDVLFSMSLISLMANNLTLGFTVKEKINRTFSKIAPEDDFTRGKLLFIQGQHYLFLFDQIKNAVDCFKKSELILRGLDEKENLAIVLAYSGFCYFYHNTSNNWPGMIEESLQLASNSSNLHLTCSVLGPIITTYLNSGDYGKALKAIKKYPTRGSNPTWMIPLLAVEGEIYCWLGHTRKANQLLKQCLDYCKGIPLPGYKIHALSTMAFIQGIKGNNEEKNRLFREAESIANKLPLKLRISRVVLKKMLSALYLGEFTSLQNTAEKLLKIGQGARIPFITAWAYYGLAISNIYKGDFGSSKEKLEHALDLIRENQILSLHWRIEGILADLSLINLDLKSARNHYQQAAKIQGDIIKDLPDKRLKKKLVHKSEISRVLLRGKSDLTAKHYSKIIQKMGLLKLLSIISTEYEQMFISKVGKRYGKVIRRQIQLAGILLAAESTQITIKKDVLAEFFGVHVRTIERDFKTLMTSSMSF